MRSFDWDFGSSVFERMLKEGICPPESYIDEHGQLIFSVPSWVNSLSGNDLRFTNTTSAGRRLSKELGLRKFRVKRNKVTRIMWCLGTLSEARAMWEKYSDRRYEWQGTEWKPAEPALKVHTWADAVRRRDAAHLRRFCAEHGKALHLVSWALDQPKTLPPLAAAKLALLLKLEGRALN